MTDTKPADRTARPTMADVDHVHRDDPEASARMYDRGPSLRTDGGETPDRESRDDEREEAEVESEERDEQTGGATGRTMKDVSHTPPTGDREVNRVFERGAEGRVDER